MKGDAEFAEWWARLLRQGTSPAGAIALIDLYREIDVRGVLPSISAPTLVMHRSGDRLVLVDQARYLAEHIPGARVRRAARRATTSPGSATRTRSSTRSRSS